jgi:hypothetical protein
MTARRVFQLWLAAAPCLAAPSVAFERFDFDQRYFIEPGYVVKDHTLVEAADGTRHLFYIKADETLPEGERAKALGHASSTDLVHWTPHPDVVPVVPGTWEEAFVWAPHIVRWNGVYWMFYTGVNWNYAQAIGVAVSVDLFNWVKYTGNPVYTPSTTWASWNSSTWSNCRDPFVVEHDGVFYMTTTAWTNQSRGAISLASSTNLLDWTDLGPLLVHPGPWQTWHVLESSNLHWLNGKWHLFCTEQDVGGAQYLSAPALTGPWDWSSRQLFDAGHATEIFQLDGQWMLSRHTTFAFDGLPRYTIKFDDLDWNTVGKPVVVWRDPLQDWTVWSGDAFYLQPTFWDNSAARSAGPAQFGGNSWIGTYELFTGPLQVGYPGLTAGDAPQGILRSRTFTLRGNRVSLRVGGGDDLDRLYVALCTADDGVRVLRATGTDTDAMRSVLWDTSAWVDREVYIEIADLSSDTWGHINVDEIVETDAAATDSPTPPAGLVLYANVPNPFNPSTRIDFEVPHAGQARLAVFDVRGRLVRELYAGALAPGRRTARWDGTTTAGSRAGSGIYYYRLTMDGHDPIVRSMVLVK